MSKDKQEIKPELNRLIRENEALRDACQKIKRHEAGCKRRNCGYDRKVDEIAQAALAQAEKKE